MISPVLSMNENKCFILGPEYGDWFIITKSRDAEYTEKGGHKMVTIKLNDMQSKLHYMCCVRTSAELKCLKLCYKLLHISYKPQHS